MLLTVLSVAATLLSLLLLLLAGHYARHAGGLNAALARDFGYWQRGAAAFFAIGALPRLIARPELEMAAAIHRGLSALVPLLLLLGAVCLGAGLHKLIPALKRYRAQREQAQRQQQIARRGGPYPQLSAEVVESIRQCAPEMTLQADRYDAAGRHANLVIDSEEEQQRYVVYALPREHLLPDGDNGPVNPNAVQQAVEVAQGLEGRPILWAPLSPQGSPVGYYAPGETAEPRPYIIEGKDVHLAELAKKFDLVARSERRRREAREAERRAKEDDPRSHIPIRTETRAEVAKQRHDRDSWERFNILAPRHPHIIDVIRRRTGDLCDRCLQQVVPEDNGKVVVTDHDHICKNEASVRIALDGSQQGAAQTMPDCSQCHYETPELYESCLSRLTWVHRGECPDAEEDAERDAEFDRREKLAELGRSLHQ